MFCQVLLYSRRVNDVEPVLEDWSFAVEYCTEEPTPKPTEHSRARRNLSLADSKGGAKAESVQNMCGKESLTVFAPEVLNLNIMESQLSRYWLELAAYVIASLF
jgi:hypothetical protein